MARASEFEPRFEGRQVLDGLLELCNALVDTEGALHAMRDGHAEGRSRQEVIPALFEGEPRPPSPEIARKLFQNLLGLWELVEQGRKVPLDVSQRPPRIKKEAPPPPGRFGAGEPDDAFVEDAWRYLEGMSKHERGRLLDAFENRQDSLLGYLDDSGLSDEGYATARQLCFELFAMLELGTDHGTRAVRPEELAGKNAVSQDAPPSLTGYVDEALFEAQQDEEQPLSRDESAQVRERVMQGLSALWQARRSTG